MGLLLDSYGQYGVALPIWQKAVQLSPNRQLMIINLAQVEQQLGDSTSASVLYKKAYDLEPNYTDAAILYFSDSGQYTKLIPLLKAQIAGDPSDIQNYLSLAGAYLKMNDKTDAIAQLNQIAKINPDYTSQVQTYVNEIKQGKPIQ